MRVQVRNTFCNVNRAFHFISFPGRVAMLKVQVNVHRSLICGWGVAEGHDLCTFHGQGRAQLLLFPLLGDFGHFCESTYVHLVSLSSTSPLVSNSLLHS
jgi:hypothetical protein